MNPLRPSRFFTCMPYFQRCYGLLGSGLLFFLCAVLSCTPVLAATNTYSILVYHRFGASVTDEMTVRTAVFTAQIARLRQEGYHFVTLSMLINGLSGKVSLPEKALAITVDDGHRSVYTELLPVILHEHLPVTLFIYPSAISNASYALSWDQLHEIMASGLAEVHSHTYWHPNFNHERKRLSPEKYTEFVLMQLEKPRTVLKAKLGTDAQLLAWPFGIHDAELEQAARSAGYKAAFALDNRSFVNVDAVMALPRYLIVDHYGSDGLIRLLKRGEREARGERP